MRFDRTPVRFDKFGEELSWFCILLLWLPTNPHWPQILSNLESYLQNDQKLLPGHRQPESERSSQQIHQAPSGQLPALLTRHSDANLFCAVLLLQLINDVHKIEHVFFFWEKTNNSRAANSSFGCNFFNLVLFAAKRLNCRIIGASWELAMWNHILFEPPVCASLLRWKTVFHVYLSGLSELLISVNLNIQVLCAGISQVMYLGMWLQMKAFTPFARYSQIAYLEISSLRVAAKRSQCAPTYTFLRLWELVNNSSYNSKFCEVEVTCLFCWKNSNCMSSMKQDCFPGFDTLLKHKQKHISVHKSNLQYPPIWSDKCPQKSLHID